MQPLVRMIGFLVISTQIMSCASYFKRKSCEETNWHQHGYQVAMKGNRLDSDSFIQECQKVEAKISYQDADIGFKEGMGKYCDLDTVFAEGKAGKTFNYDMCDGLSRKAMHKRYADGVNIYCQEGNGYIVGTSGTVYQNVCPKNLEPKFLGEYRRGRKVFLTKSLTEKELQVGEIDQEIAQLRSQQSAKTAELSAISNAGRVIARERVYDPRTKSYKDELRVSQDPAIKMRQESIQWDLNRISNNINSAESRKRSTQEEMRKIREELITL